MKQTIYSIYIKRILDVCAALLVMVLFCWLYAIIALLVKINMGSPVIFKQERPGQAEKIFTIYKFRTMNYEKDKYGNDLPDTERLNDFGIALRKASLDEIPEILNILKGDMSFIGPRPLPIIYLSYYSERERKRHVMKPGLTGLAQVNGRNAITWEEKFGFDLQYLDNISFALDAKIFLKTIAIVLKKADIGQAEEAPISLHVLRRERDEDEYCWEKSDTKSN